MKVGNMSKNIKTVLIIIIILCMGGIFAYFIIKGDNGSKNISNLTNESTQVNAPTSESYVLNKDKEVVVNNINFSNINYNQETNNVSFEVTLDKTIELESQNMFFVLFSDTAKEVKRIYLTGTTDTTLKYNIDLSESAHYFQILRYEEFNNYPQTVMTSSGEEILKCVKSLEMFEYKFINGNLSNLYYVIDFEDKEPSIETKNLEKEYNEYSGVNAQINEYILGHNFQVTIDYNEYNGNANIYFFNRETKNEEVWYKMESLGFFCQKEEK